MVTKAIHRPRLVLRNINLLSFFRVLGFRYSLNWPYLPPITYLRGFLREKPHLCIFHGAHAVKSGVNESVACHTPEAPRWPAVAPPRTLPMRRRRSLARAAHEHPRCCCRRREKRQPQNASAPSGLTRCSPYALMRSVPPHCCPPPTASDRSSKSLLVPSRCVTRTWRRRRARPRCMPTTRKRAVARGAPRRRCNGRGAGGVAVKHPTLAIEHPTVQFRSWISSGCNLGFFLYLPLFVAISRSLANVYSPVTAQSTHGISRQCIRVAHIVRLRKICWYIYKPFQIFFSTEFVCVFIWEFTCRQRLKRRGRGTRRI